MPPDAIALALGYLNRRERTVAEVRTRLERSKCAPEEIAMALDELLELGTLDDGRYARLFIEDKRNLEGWGRTRIELGLSAHGVPREVSQAALAASASGGGDELARAEALLRRRWPDPPGGDLRERERAFAMLVRKGYESEVAADAVRAWRRS